MVCRPLRQMKRKEEEFTLTAYFLKGIAFHLTEGEVMRGKLALNC